MSDAYPTRLRVLKLTSFRNYKKATLELEPHSAVFFGPNGSGKTNLLEAISYLSPGRGLRRANYQDVALTSDKGGKGEWAVSSILSSQFGEVEIGTGYVDTERTGTKTRKIRIDRETAKTNEALLDYARLVWLIPAMDSLFTGPAGDRRRFLDRMVLAIDPTHGSRVNAFDKAIRNRNKILEEAPGNAPWLDAAEAQIAELGTAISAARRELVSLLVGEIEERVSSANPHFPKAALALEGTVDALLADHAAADAEDRYRTLLVERRLRDARAGRTLDGPHRSDLIVYHHGKSIAARLCSTGEQKALLIGLVLAHTRLVTRLSKMTPIVLLDEIAAHLDEKRRAALFDVLDNLGCQSFMTGTDRALFAGLEGRGQFFHVENGSVINA